MTLRITQSMLYGRALQDLRASLFDGAHIQERIATGRRINRPSDDPAAILRVLPLRAELRDLDAMLEHAGVTKETLDLGASALEESSTIMHRVRELLVQANNGTASLDNLHTFGDEADQLLGQLLGLANTSRAGRYLFGGAVTDAPPFVLAGSGSDARVSYAGDDQRVESEVAPGLRMVLNTPGDVIFQHRSRSATEFQGTTGARPTGAKDSAVGFGMLTVSFGDLASAPPEITAGSGASTALGALSYTYSGGALSIGGGPPVTVPATDQTFTTADGRTINLTVSAPPTPPTGTLTAAADLSLDGGATATTVDFTAGEVQVRDGRDGTVVNVDVSLLARTGQERLTFAGTFDPFTLLLAMRDALSAADSGNRSETTDKLQRLLAEVDFAHDAVLDGLTDYGSRSQQVDLLRSRVIGLHDAARESLSDTEDSDLAESIVEMNRQQLAYQASLAVSGRIVQTTLLDFLR